MKASGATGAERTFEIEPGRLWVMGGCGGTYAPGPLVPNDRTSSMLIASSPECQEQNLFASYGQAGEKVVTAARCTVMGGTA